MGDVIEIDARFEIAKAILLPSNYYDDLILLAYAKDIEKAMNAMDIHLTVVQRQTLMEDDSAFKLVMDSQGRVVGKNGTHVDNDGVADGLSDDDVFYVVPNLTAADMERLRSGLQVDPKDMCLALNYTLTKDIDIEGYEIFTAGTTGSFNLTIRAEDYERNGALFFGDRPLDNPGYSEFTLSGLVGIGQDNNVLDVYRVEQRLKYLGFCSFDKTIEGDPVEFEVDGIWDQTNSTPGPHYSIAGSPEEGALRAFYAMTHHGTANTPINANNSWGGAGGTTATPNVSHYQYTGNNSDAIRQVSPGGETQGETNLEWLNAYNAPHLVDVYKILGIPRANNGTPTNNRLSSTHDYFLSGNPDPEYHASSWVLDILLAWEASQRAMAGETAQEAGKLISPNPRPESPITISPNGTPWTPTHPIARLTALTRPNGNPLNGGTVVQAQNKTHSYGLHGTGMAIDWGFNSNYVNPTVVNSTGYNTIGYSITITLQGWSVANALSIVQQVGTAEPDIANEENALLNFLSLYNIMIGDGNAGNHNGSWEEIDIINGSEAQKTEIRTALFGGGTQATALIQHVYLGDAGVNNNPADRNIWQRSIAALEALGIKAQNQNYHEHHYHIDIVQPARVPIGGNNLMADSVAIPEAAYELVSILAEELGISENDMDMYYPVDLYLEPSSVIVMAAAPADNDVAGALGDHGGLIVVAQMQETPRRSSYNRSRRRRR
jgi:hypothetical protein